MFLGAKNNWKNTMKEVKLFLSDLGIKLDYLSKTNNMFIQEANFCENIGGNFPAIFYSQYQIDKPEFIREVFKQRILKEVYLSKKYASEYKPYIIIDEELYFYWRLKYGI